MAHEDIVDLTDICKSAHGLSSQHRQAEPLDASHLAIAETDAHPVSLVSLTHHTGVNALAPEQTVSFGPNLTVVYGENGAGKSGYTRILKRACRSRFVEEVLGDVLAGQAPLTAKATINVRHNGIDTPVAWTGMSTPSGSLANISVFDAHCVPVYLGDKTDVAFRPFGLDVFDGLASVCAHVRRGLETELGSLSSSLFAVPATIAVGTTARKFVDTLTALTKEAELTRLATLSDLETGQLRQLEEAVKDLAASDPKQRAREFLQKAARLETAAGHLELIAKTLGLEAIGALTGARARVVSAQAALDSLRKTALTADLLPETGSPEWRALWSAAVAFSAKSVLGSTFPSGAAHEQCPLCQQDIQADAASRLKHFAEFASSTAQADLRTAEATFDQAVKAMTGLQISKPDVVATIAELTADDSALGGRINQLMTQGQGLLDSTQAALQTSELSLQAQTFDDSVAVAVRAMATNLRTRAAQLQSARTDMSSQEKIDLANLRARLALAENIELVKTEIERKKRIGAYTQALADTATNQITIKSTELTKKLVTDRLKGTFTDELKDLEFTHLSVEIQAAGGARGALFHKLAFRNAPGVSVTDVLSEGESRALSLAAFLTELSTSPTRSGIIFDDPVSSLDHIWRERIARRLVAEAKDRQVIVFTHDLVFLKTLVSMSAKASVPCQHQYVRRDGQAGICSPDLPWVAMNVKDRLGVLRSRWQVAEKLQRTEGAAAYQPRAQEIFALLRETWERGITEVLLNDAVDRYRQSIESKRVAVLHDITDDDCRAVENGMTECSRWMIGHDEALADGAPFPDPEKLKSRIDELEAWARTIRTKRR